MKHLPSILALLLAFLRLAAADEAPAFTEGFHSLVKQEPFEVQGNSIPALVADLKAKGPMDDGQKFFARTNWHLHWNYRYESQGGRFFITTLSVTAEVAYHMPKRILPPNEPDHVAEKWARFMAALTTHEQGHAKNGIDHGKALYDTLRAPHFFPSAQALKNFIQTETEKCLAEARAADKEYDRQTRHGATQGATLR